MMSHDVRAKNLKGCGAQACVSQFLTFQTGLNNKPYFFNQCSEEIFIKIVLKFNACNVTRPGITIQSDAKPRETREV